MKLIDRYLNAVTEHLPDVTREDVISELRANIYDMLPCDFTESDVRKVLGKLGNPISLADEYSERKKYLIGPALYDTYLSVLKLVIGIVTIVVMCLTLINWALTPPINGKFVQTSIRFSIDLIIAPIQGVLQGFLWVTAIFAILERNGINEGNLPFVKKKWSPDDLIDMPVSNKRKISRVETVFSIFFTILFTQLVYYHSNFIGLYIKGDSGLILVSPLFVNERLQSYIPVILLFAIIQLCLFIWKFIAMQWNYPLAIANCVHNTLLSVFVCLLLSDDSLFNQEFISKVSTFIKSSLTENTSNWLSINLWVFIIIFISISLLDSILGFIKCKNI